MRVLCSTTAGDGHFGPLKTVALACRNAGHEVRVAAPESYAGAVGRAGLPHIPFADAPPERLRQIMASLPGLERAEANRTVVQQVFGRLDARPALPDILAAVAEWRPDVILRDPCEFGSLAAGEADRIPHVEVAIGVAELMVSLRTQLTDPLAELDTLAGLPEGRLLAAMTAAPVLTTVPMCLDAASIESNTGDLSGRQVFRYRVPRPATSGQLPAPWGDSEHPLIYVTFGTVAAGLGHLTEVFRTALAALADLPVRVLLTTGHAGGIDLSPPWPANAHVEKYWPQDDVMPHAAAIVGHGGFGTTMSALAAGVPQVVVPLFADDQFLNAERVAEIGAGVRLDGGPAAVAALGSAVTHVLADGKIRRRAGEVATEIDLLPTVSEVVPEIERLAGPSI